jgi:hypothetical protein
MPDPLLGLTRRHFLAAAGGTAGAVLLGACGGGDDEPKADPESDVDGDLVLVLYVPEPIYVAERVNRIPFGLADSQGLIEAADTPEEIEVEVLGPDNERIGEPITVASHTKGLERAYFPLELELGEAGIYTVRADLGGDAPTESQLAVNVVGEMQLIKPGDVMPALESPTAADARGVNPICTADPVCALHDVTVAEALAAGGPLAILVATPAYCRSAACGPVHGILLEALADHPGVKALHLEVFADPAKSLQVLAPAVNQLLLPFEPALLLVGSDGKVAQRLDAIYDAVEVDAALGSLS